MREISLAPVRRRNEPVPNGLGGRNLASESFDLGELHAPDIFPRGDVVLIVLLAV
jgi:hypothetical protein